jgi:hypothetical protein
LDIISIFCSLLKSNDDKIVSISIESLWNILNFEDESNDIEQYMTSIKEYQGFEIINDLTERSKNKSFIDTALKLLDLYYLNNKNEE